MNKTELQKIERCFSRSFGLKHCFASDILIRYAKQELSEQTGLTKQFVEANISEIKAIAKSKTSSQTTLLN